MSKNTNSYILIWLIFIFTPLSLNSQELNKSGRTKRVNPVVISIGTNLIYDILLMPNLEIEYYLKNPKYTLQVEATIPWYKRESKHQYFQIQRYIGHFNYYPFSNRGWHFSPYFEGGVYDLEERLGWFPFKHKNHQGFKGWFIGSGIAVGYSIKPQRVSKIRLDFKIAFGFIHTRYKEYIAKSDLYPFQLSIKRNIFAPTQIGATIKYEIRKRGLK